MRRFVYLRDGLFLSACALYALNRWIIKPIWPHGPSAWWISDLLLVPCAAPVCLWIEREAGFRKQDGPPTAAEIGFLLVIWSLLFEVIAPRFIPWATSDWRDVIAYAVGGVFAWSWWNRPKRAPASSGPLR